MEMNKMPNWCFNKLIVTGPDIPFLVKQIGVQDSLFSFEKIIPMPEALSDINENYAEYAFAAALQASPEKFQQIVEILRSYSSKSYMGQFIMADILNALGDENKIPSIFINMYKALNKGLPISDFYNGLTNTQNHMLKLSELAEIGIRFIDNIMNYGSVGWYDWRLQNWNTKWDLDDSSIVVLLQEEHALILSFDTAWSPPWKVITKMGILFPEYKFRLTWNETGNELQGKLNVFHEKVVMKEYEPFSEKRMEYDLQSIYIPNQLRWISENKS
jgi:hypothetical protein